MNAQKPERPTLQREAAMLAKGKKRILGSSDWLTSQEVAGLTHLSPGQLSQWEQAGEIFTLTHEGIDYFPIYAFDPENGYQPRSTLASVITVLTPKKDGWGMAFWFGSSNSFLGGRMPKNVLRDDPQIVLAAAKDEISGLYF